VRFNVPRVPVINNVDVEQPSEPGAVKRALARQAASPVRWVETIERMVAAGVTDVLECGPGRVLAGLAKRIHPALRAHALTDPQALEAALEAVK
jgi:[acyl-carrier-protein] S-malonyltransferase